MSSTDRIKYFYAEEAVIGQTPAAPPFKALRITGESIKNALAMEQSKELRSDRTEPDQVITSANVSGDLMTELLWDAHDDFIAAVVGQNAWTVGVVGTQTLVNGVAGKSFSVLKQFLDLGDINHIFRGLFVNTWTLNIQKKAIVTGTFGLIGMTSDNGPIAGLVTGLATYAPPSATDPINGASNITSLKMNGAPMTSAIDLATIAITNNYRPQEQLGALGPTGYTQGRIQVTGTMDIYFKTEVEYNMYKAGTPFSFEVDFTDNDLNDLNILLDRCKFEDMEVVAGGTNQDIIAKGKWRALYNAGTNRVLQITSVAHP